MTGRSDWLAELAGMLGSPSWLHSFRQRHNPSAQIQQHRNICSLAQTEEEGEGEV